jgi:hypothetical protein
MQNGRAALSLVPYDIKKAPNEKVIRKLLYPLYQPDGRLTKMAFFLFYPIYNQVDKKERNKTGFTKFFLSDINKTT